MNDALTANQRWLVSVDEEGVLTLPDDIIETLGWMEGDSLEFIEDDDGSFQIVKIDETFTDSGETGSQAVC